MASDVILYVRRDGVTWTEWEVVDFGSLEQNIIAIRDAEDRPCPTMLCYVPPNQPGWFPDNNKSA